MYDVLIISGLSRTGGKEFGAHEEFLLKKDGKVMHLDNLQKHFGLKPENEENRYKEVPYLSGIYLYDYLSKKGFDCRLINFLDKEFDRFQDFVKEGPKIIALSTSFLVFIQSIKEVTSTIRKEAPDAFLVAGGQFIYSSYRLLQKKDQDYITDPCYKTYFFLNEDPQYHEDIDLFVVEEQGEFALSQIVDKVNKGQSPFDVKNTAYYENGRLHFNEREKEDNSFEDNIISWDTIDSSYIGEMIPIRGSIGCPYKCKFCSFVGSNFKYKSTAALEAELNLISKREQIKSIRFTDDNFFITKENVEEVCSMMIKNDYHFTWAAFIRANYIDNKRAKLLKETKFTYASIGMESGDNGILSNMMKKDTIENFTEVLGILNNNDICTRLSFIVGSPGETEETVNNTIENINNFSTEGSGFNTCLVFPFVVFPLSPIFDPAERKKYNLVGTFKKWKHNTMDCEGAEKMARKVLGEVTSIFPYYPREFEVENKRDLRLLYEQRDKVRRLELARQDEGVLNREWDKLKDVVSKLKTEV